MKNISTVILLSIILFSSCENNPPAAKDKTDSQYTEQHRPSFHFSPPSKWMNDPNGMVYYDGEYHLFYQYYPDSTVWGPMHWGHAVSKNLLQWEHLPIALFPDDNGWIFSGSAVVDWNNTSGLGKNGKPPLVAIFTSHNSTGEKAGRNDFQTQSIAYSLDNGRKWTKYAGNPVLKSPGIRDFRDPKVSWHEASQQWIMTLAVQDHISFYASPDLKTWSHQSDFGKESGAHGGVWECPDLFPLQVPGSKETKWVLLVSINPGGPNGGSATQYFVGNFDGKTFKNDNTAGTTLWMDYGRDNYAGVTWSDIPKADGRRLLMGWMSNWQYATTVPTEKWRSANTIPRELTLKNTPAGLRLMSSPVEELEKLRGKSSKIDAQKIEGVVDLSATLGFPAAQMEAVLEFELPNDSSADLGIEVSNSKGERYRVGYNAATKQFYSDRTQAGKTAFSTVFAEKIHVAPRLVNGNIVRLHVYFDRASAELFGDDGATVMTDILFPNEDYTQVKIYAENGSVQLKSGVFYAVKSIWE